MTISMYRTNAASRVTRILILLVLPALALATATFEQRWHWYREDIGNSVAITTDGGYLVGGETWVDTTLYGIALARTDSLGDTTSVRHLLGVGHGSGYLCALRGGDFVAAGIHNGSHLFARGFSPSGDSIWSYDAQRRGLLYALISTSDGGCALAGRDSMRDMAVIRLDSAGNEVWARGYDEPLVQGASVYGIAETRDHGLILCGDATDYVVKYVRLVRTDSAGDTLWTRLLSGPVGPSLQAVCETPDGGFLAVGYEYDTLRSQNAVYLLHTDSNGAITWNLSISLPGAGTQATALRPTRDSGYVIAGTIDWTDSARAWLVKLDANADTVWTSALPGIGREQAEDVWQTTDGGYVVVGTSDSAGASVLLIKTDSLGHAPYGIAEEKPVPHQRIALSVAPNPAKGVVRIQYSLPVNTPTSLRMYDVTGHLVYSSFVTRTSDFPLDLRSMPAGVYLLRIESGCGSATRKVVVE
jgi:hypothetical protein